MGAQGITVKSSQNIVKPLLKLMVSHDLPRSTVTNQSAHIRSTRFAFDPSVRTHDGPLFPGAGFRIENLGCITFT